MSCKSVILIVKCQFTPDKSGFLSPIWTRGIQYSALHTCLMEDDRKYSILTDRDGVQYWSRIEPMSVQDKILKISRNKLYVASAPATQCKAS
jgi:hypothetical protein